MQGATLCDIFSEHLIASGIFFNQIVFFLKSFINTTLFTKRQPERKQIFIKRNL